VEPNNMILPQHPNTARSALAVESSAFQNQKVPLCLSTGTRRWALPQYEFGLDDGWCMALPRASECTQIHQQLQRGVCISQRSVSNLLERYDELVAISLSDIERINTIIGAQASDSSHRWATTRYGT